jgi:hypothetical protein
MTYLLAVVGGILGGALGWIAAAAITLLIAGALGVSDFEGGRAMQAIWGAGPIGGLVGLIAGIWLVLRLRSGRTTPGRMAGRIGLVVVGVGALTGSVLAYFYATQPVLNPNGIAPRLVFEIRLPVGDTPDALKVELHTQKNVMPADLEHGKRVDGGRPIIAGSVELYYRSAWRNLVLKTSDGVDRIFMLKLAPSPGHARDLGAWEHLAFTAGPGPSEPVRATADDHFDVRYRVAWPGED